MTIRLLIIWKDDSESENVYHGKELSLYYQCGFLNVFDDSIMTGIDSVLLSSTKHIIIRMEK